METCNQHQSAGAGQPWTKCQLHTVKLGYNELGYNELSAVTNKNKYLVGSS